VDVLVADPHAAEKKHINAGQRVPCIVKNTTREFGRGR
jgi:hypothetical protein